MKKTIILSVFLACTYSVTAQEKPAAEKAKELYAAKDYEKAYSMMEKASPEEKKTAAYWIFLAKINFRLEDTDEGIDNLYSALKIKSDEPEVYLELVKALASTEKNKGAFELCEKALKKFPTSKDLRIQKALLYPKFAKSWEGIKLIESMKEEFPNDSSILNAEAYIYTILGDLEKAEMSLRWAVSADKSNMVLKRNLGLILEKLGDRKLKEKDKARAKEYYTESVKELNAPASKEKKITDLIEKIQKKADAL
ncbi:MAG TPA: tetratricopeptide repeat protein [Leptospiraceae bacterium]|nr:tetratricopeptide repeat protein [Leptospiraceae bacterium]HMY67985.1 tetratricopeptide repeat protein [Leptospiraceae bacterium]HMZ60233.1 tetratricopeptide repeat protein [Leptospiraceae bacterium]HNF16527.1 tetratricopeptide repeat protein [Leptospiraceae bacterium]HNF24291.1 tetratricopeptide repeat protein [Leptospiraceae bacterium]